MEKETEQIQIPEIITVGDFAKRIGLPVSQIISELIKNGVMATINDNIDYDTAEIIAEYLGKPIVKEEVAEEIEEEVERVYTDKKVRPPVVAVMGHVDHGKTSLLDAIRETNVAGKEKGGITQKIGAYQVEKNGKRITFIDTPGHEAFDKMREHGARVTDIALIVVAADDGVRPQTLEAIQHARKANTAIITVINKIDKPGADINRVKNELSEIDLLPEEWGGKTITVEVSAKEKKGISELLDMILLLTEVLELKADYGGQGEGVVIESHLDMGKGPVGTVLVKNGIIKIGDYLQVGEVYGKVKSLEDFKGARIKEAGPSVPVQIAGLKGIPTVSEIARTFDDEKIAKKEAEKTKRAATVKSLSKVKKIGISELTEAAQRAEMRELEIVLKADSKGSLDAIIESLEKIKNEEVGVKIVFNAVGNINEKDVMMAAATKSKIVFGFEVNMSVSVSKLAEREDVKFSRYNVIYELLDDVRTALEALLPKEIIETEMGALKILMVFKSGKEETIVGGKVISGKLEKGLNAKILRDKEEIAVSKFKTLKREKEEVLEVASGTECGIGLEGKFDLAENDIVKAIRVEERKRTL